MAEGRGEGGGLRAYFLAFCSFAPRRPGRNFSNLKFPSGPTFALQLHPRTEGRGCLYCARQRCPRCGHSTTTSAGDGVGVSLFNQPPPLHPLFPPARISAFVNTRPIGVFLSNPFSPGVVTVNR